MDPAQAAPGVGGRLSRLDADARDLPRPRARVRAPRRQAGRHPREAIGGAYSGLEEAKADVVGMFALKWLVDRGRAAEARLEEYYASYVAGIFRTVALRHRRGARPRRDDGVQLPVRAGRHRPGERRYRIDYAKMPDAIARLAKELLEQEATGDRARAEAWFAKYDRDARRRSPQAPRRRADVPIDVDPIFSFFVPAGGGFVWRSVMGLWGVGVGGGGDAPTLTTWSVRFLPGPRIERRGVLATHGTDSPTFCSEGGHADATGAFHDVWEHSCPTRCKLVAR